jgi:hypothetical protein
VNGTPPAHRNDIQPYTSKNEKTTKASMRQKKRKQQPTTAMMQCILSTQEQATAVDNFVKRAVALFFFSLHFHSISIFFLLHCSDFQGRSFFLLIFSISHAAQQITKNHHTFENAQWYTLSRLFRVDYPLLLLFALPPFHQ